MLLLTEQHWQEKLLLLSVAGRKRSSRQRRQFWRQREEPVHCQATGKSIKTPGRKRMQRAGEGDNGNIGGP